MKIKSSLFNFRVDVICGTKSFINNYLIKQNLNIASLSAKVLLFIRSRLKLLRVVKIKNEMGIALEILWNIKIIY